MIIPRRTLALGLLTLSALATAGEPVSLQLRQAVANLPAITLYLDARDAAGQAASGLDPAQFSATLGAQAAEVKSLQPLAQSGEGLAYVFLVDVSKSLKPAQFSAVQQALNDWIGALSAKDRAAILSFGDSVRLRQDFTGDAEKLRAEVNRLAPSDRHTQLHAALAQGLALARRVDPGLPGPRAIVTLTDGQDDAAGGVTAQEVLDRLREDPIPIYTIGFAPPPLTPAKDAALKSLGLFARTSGGEYLAGGDKPGETYLAARRRIQEGWVARLHCPACTADGRVQRLQLSGRLPSRLLGAGLDIRLLPPPPPARAAEPQVPPVAEKPPVPAPAPSGVWAWISGLPLWAYLAFGAFLLLDAVTIGVLVARRRAKARAAATPSPSPAAEPVAPPVVPVTVARPTPPPTPGLRLTFTRIDRYGPRRDYSLELRDRAVLGRGPRGCDLVIEDDPEISTTHCLLLREDGQVRVRDLNSTNGTLVNGAPIRGDFALKDGDLLLLGETELRLTWPQ